MLKNITLSSDAFLIQKARQKASQENTSLNNLFRQWLARYVGQDQAVTKYQDLMERLSHVQAGRHFGRDELNER